MYYLLSKFLRMKYTQAAKSDPKGLGKKERDKYSALLRKSKATISVAQAEQILDMANDRAAMLLARLARKGWLKRIAYGVYIPVPPESPTSDIVVEEPFIIAQQLYDPCYIGGMNAANYWDLTDQIFQTITVMTQKKVRDRQPEIAGTKFLIHSIKASYFFGLKSIWLDNVKVSISDPTRTIIDMMIFPQFCGGLRFITDVLKSYFNSKNKNIELLTKYVELAENGAAIKRLGFLIERYYPNEEQLIIFCKDNITKGYSKIVPTIECVSLIKRWNLWVPSSWKE
jgi:predicted transcriptional regulator of viral defense system